MSLQKYVSGWLCAVLLWVAPAARSAEVKAAPVRSKITVDGQLNEPAWQKAPQASGFHLLKGKSSQSPKAQTRFRVLVDDDAIYIGIICDEPSMARLKAKAVVRDGRVFGQDCIELFIDPTNTGTSYYQLALSANNDQWDAYYIEGGNTTLGAYSSQWTSAVHRDKKQWSAEIRLPLSSLIHTRPAEFGSTWRLNVTRERKPVSELSTWSELSSGFHEPAHFGTVKGMPAKAADQDVAVLAMEPRVDGRSGDGHATGSLGLSTLASQEAAGTYRLTLVSEGQPLGQTQTIEIPAGQGEIEVADLTFPKTGRLEVRVELHRDRDLVLGVSYPALVSYEPLAITLDEPFYSACIFPGQKVDTIRGSVAINLPASLREQGELVLKLEGPGLSKPVVKRVPMAQSPVSFELDARRLAQGDARLTVTAVRGDETLASTQQTIRKLASNDGSMVWIDRDLRLIVNGKPQMMRGWYGVGGYLVSRRILERWPTAKDAFPHSNYGKIVGVEPERMDRSDAGNAKKDVKPSKKVFDELRRRVLRAKKDPDTWSYYLCDEPECRQISPVYLKYMYDVIKELDPYHPVLIATRDPIQFADCADILSPHPYLDPTVDDDGQRKMRSPKAIRDQMRYVYQGGQGRKLPWFTSQAFSYGFSTRFSVYPTFDEVRCMVWASMANGNKGFWPFIYHNAMNRPDVMLGYRCAYESLARLEPFFLATQPAAEVEVDAPDDGVDVLVQQVEGKTLVVAVNLLDHPVHAKVRSSALASLSQLVFFRGQGQVPVSEGEVDLEFEPYGVRVLTWPKLDQGMKTLAQAKEELDRANAQRKRAGNILFGRGREIEFDASANYTRGGALQESLTDGVRDSLGWADLRSKTHPAWLEMAFPSFVPEFRKAIISGDKLAGMALLAWKRGKWVSLGVAPKNAGYDVTFNLDKSFRTVKLRLEWPTDTRGCELYEIELYK